MIVQTHALWIIQASTTTQALLSLRECTSNISSKFPPKQTLLPIWATAVITTWLHIFFTKFLSNTRPSPPLKKFMPQAQGATDISKEIPGVLSARSYRLHRLYSLHYIELFHPPMCTITLVMNITTMLKVRKILNYIRYTMFAIFANMLNYVRKMFHHRCLTGSKLRLCLSTKEVHF